MNHLCSHIHSPHPYISSKVGRNQKDEVVNCWEADKIMETSSPSHYIVLVSPWAVLLQNSFPTTGKIWNVLLPLPQCHLELFYYRTASPPQGGYGKFYFHCSSVTLSCSITKLLPHHREDLKSFTSIVLVSPWAVLLQNSFPPQGGSGMFYFHCPSVTLSCSITELLPHHREDMESFTSIVLVSPWAVLLQNSFPTTGRIWKVLLPLF